MRSSGFRWTFSSAGAEATCGRFANGDYWVAPAPGAAGVTLESLDGSGRLSLDENPSVEANGLLGTSPAYGNHVASENLLGSLPRSFSGPTSLVAALQRDETASGRCGAASIAGNCLDAYDVLTILPAVPPGAGSLVLRPALDGSAKKLVAWSALDTGRIPRRTWFAGTGADGFEAIRQRWSHSIEILSMLTLDGRFFSEGGRAFRASAFLPDYAAGVAAQWHEDLMTVMSDAVHADDPGRRAAIAAMLVYGKDVFHAMYGPDGRRRNWGAGAGQWLGRFPAAAFFAAVSRDGSYARTLASAATDLLGHPDLRGPHELEQVNEGVNGPVWGDFPDRMSAFEVGGYWNEMLKAQCFEGAHGVCNVGIGKRTSRDPYGYIDGPPAQPGQGYMYVALGPQRALVATMFLMPEMCAIVNDDLLVAYVDRVQSHGISTAGDPCAPPDPREDPVACDAHVNRGCVYYGVTWGPDPAHPGQCIRNGEGRFPALDGVPGKVLYSSPQVESNWASIRGTAPRCARAESW